MGIVSWRCAKTTQGIPVQRHTLTEVVAFLPNGQRLAGYLSNYAELLSARLLDEHNQPLPEDENLPEHQTVGLLDAYCRTVTPPATPNEHGEYRMKDIDRVADLIKLVRLEHVEPSDTFDRLPASEPDPWQGYTYETDLQWQLPLQEAEALGELNPSLFDSAFQEALPDGHTNEPLDHPPAPGI